MVASSSYIATSIFGLLATLDRALMTTRGGLQYELFAVNSVELRRTQTAELRRPVHTSSAVDARV